MHPIDRRIQSLQARQNWLPPAASGHASRGLAWRAAPYDLVELNVVSACSRMDEETFQALDARFRSVDSRWLLTLAHGLPWMKRLEAAGYSAYGICAGLSRPTARPIPAPERIVVREVQDEDTLRDWHRIRRNTKRDHAEPDAAQLAAELDLIARGVMHLVVAEQGEVIAAAGMTLPPGSLTAWLWGGATRPDAAGRGAYRALVAWRVAQAAARGRAEVLTVAVVATSVPMLLRMGFGLGGTWLCWERPGQREGALTAPETTDPTR